MATELLAVGSTAANSSDVIIASGSTVYGNPAQAYFLYRVLLVTRECYNCDARKR